MYNKRLPPHDAIGGCPAPAEGFAGRCNWHDWERSETEAAHRISTLTPTDGMVLDPMCGSGTTRVAARRLNRRFMGAQLNPMQAKRATARLEQVDPAEEQADPAEEQAG